MSNRVLTREQILAMPAGPKLDKAVYEHVMGFDLTGFKWPRTGYEKMHEMFKEEPSSVIWVEFPKYSTDISAAWKVVEKVTGEEWMLHGLKDRLDPQSKLDGYECCLFQRWTGASRTATAETAPEAICKAALLSLLKED